MIKYKKINHPKYKYQLTESYTIFLDKFNLKKYIFEPPDVPDPFILINRPGRMWIKKGYSWDGPSGPTIDTQNFMRGSLVHDALYQLMRAKRIPLSMRKYADELLRDICIGDGMSRFRAWYVYRAVRMFGEKYARP